MIHEYVTDFETTSVRVYDRRYIAVFNSWVQQLDREKSEAWVCAWGNAPISATTNEEITRGRTIGQYIDHIKSLAESLPPRDKLTIFTHNLGFDGAFIMYYILTKTTYIKRNEVRDNTLYSFEVYFPDIKRNVIFRDSAKIFPRKVEELGELYGISKLKGEWDYNKYRDEHTPISESEWEYIDHDILIVCKALKDYRDRGYTQNTIASIAYNQRLTFTYPQFRKAIAMRVKDKDIKRARQMFPDDIRPLSKELYIILIQAYFGGWTYLNPKWYDIVIDVVIFLDENSGYPDKMANAILPVGEAMYWEFPDEQLLQQIRLIYPCIAYVIDNLTIELKSEKHLPVAMFQTQNDGYIRCQGKVIRCLQEHVVLTNVDWDMIQNEYDIKDDYVVSMVIAFRGKRGQYRKYIEHWSKIKADATIRKKRCKELGDIEGYHIASQDREVAKLMQVTGYGKDGTKILRENKTTVVSDNGLLDIVNDKEETDIEYYLPSAIWITAYQRYDTYNAAKLAGDEYIYSDTDSDEVTPEGYNRIFEASKEGKIRLHETDLGAFKIEKVGYDARFLRQKTYGYTDEDGNKVYTVSGAGADIKAAIKWEDFRPGMKIPLDILHSIKNKDGEPLQGKLRPVAVRGGVILEECPFEIRKYETWDEKGGKNVPINLFFETISKMKAGVI